MVHIHSRNKRLKGEKSIDSLELETAEGIFFFSSRGQTPWSHVKHMAIQLVKVTGFTLNKNNNLGPGFFTEYLEKLQEPICLFFFL